MNRFGRVTGTLLGAVLIGLAQVSFAQGDCLNQNLFPTAAVTPDAGGAVTTIAANSYQTEYSQITGIVSGATYRFTLQGGGYITVREGTFGGPVVGQGFGIVDIVAASTADLFPHWNVDEFCNTASNPLLTTVQFFGGGCTPPLAFASIVEDCDQGFFMIDVDVVGTGSGSTVNIFYDVFGNPNSVPGVGVGVTQIGPFFFGEQVTVIVEHESDASCNMDLGLFVESGECPVYIFCGQGPQNFSYCYPNNDSKVWNYTALGGTGSLVLTYISGNIQSSFGDILTVYDGPDNTGPILFQNPNTGNFDLSGLVLPSLTGAIHIELTTDGFGSCGDGSTIEWNWQVECLNCQLPAATATNVDDCVNNQFSIPVDVTSLGDGSSVTLVYTVDGGAPQQVVGVGLGVTTLGPFTVNQVIALFLQHESDPACTITMGSFTDSGDCPNLIVCGAPPLVETYCYVANDSQTWSYQSIGAGTLRLTFHFGTIESHTWEDLRIYDGVDATGTLVFEHLEFLTYNLGPEGSAINNTFPDYYEIQIYSLTGNLYMEMSSDGSVQCGEPFPNTSYDSWEWDVVCLDCSIPVGDVTIVDDCANSQFSLDVNVTSTGSGTTAAIDYTLNGAPQTSLTGLPLGVTTLGPFSFGDLVDIVLAHESNALCNIPLGEYTDTGTCPLLIPCDGTVVNDSACYANSEDLRWYYQGTGTFPLGIYFFSGDFEFQDSLVIYDGGDITAPVLFAGGGFALDMTDQFFFTTNPEHRLTLRIFSNTFTSCADGFVGLQTEWQIGCLDCVPAAATFSIAQDCENFQYFVDVVVTDLGTDPSPEITNDFGLPGTFVTAPGTYQIGPFTSGTTVEIAIENDANSLCNIYSGPLVNPLCPTILCGGTALAQTYCYTNLENNAWAYEAPVPGGTINLQFVRGTIESNTWDDLIIYDGPSSASPVLFTHGAGTTNLGPVGSAILSGASPYETINVTTTGPNIYMTLTTDGSVACTSQTGFWDPWEWLVQCNGCGAPGVSYNIIPDCLHREYTTEVIVTAPPTASGMTIENFETGDLQTITDVGVYSFGPYENDTLSLFGVTDLSEPNCTFFSDSITYTNDSCWITSCGFDNYEYCYEDNEDRWYTYVSDDPVPTTIAFLWGQMLPNDRIVVYNGPDENSLVIYQGNNGGNLAGFAVNSQNPEYTVTMRIQSNASGSCANGDVTIPLRWTVGCGAVGVEEVEATGFAVYPNPTEGLLYINVGAAVAGNARVRVLDMSGRTVLEQPMTLRTDATNALDMGELVSGQYVVQLITNDEIKFQRVQVAR